MYADLYKVFEPAFTKQTELINYTINIESNTLQPENKKKM